MDNQEVSTYFSAYQVPFPQPANTKIKTIEFLNAARTLVGLLEKLGKVFAPARYDMNGNIEKLTRKYNEDKMKNEYVEDMLLVEKQEGKLFAIDALMWLRRGLHFMLEFFENIVNDTACQEDLSSFIKEAYALTLQKYHGWFGSNLFSMLSRLVPHRKVLLKYIALDKDNCEEYVLRDMKAFTVNLRICVNHLIEFYRDNELESEAKV
ncbi:hypothetical protein ILUMI_21739 [Ignelater luminosus]|uniref:Glycolipid transfer protein domain-containing protein n=1 Tax=Ignelater luminosus TaxID=2038154 RepID=A0A8K0CFW0_IGNLU|nr:hypothetical protein ILUMI_21739 [Ignelater luminosus]